MAATLAGVLGTFGRAYLAAHSLSSAMARVWRAIEACRNFSINEHLLDRGRRLALAAQSLRVFRARPSSALERRPV